MERFLAHWTDILITINKEDYQQAKAFHLRKNGKLILHPGVGVNIQDFQNVMINRDKKREELGVAKNQTVFITVGELIDRKNHDILLDAMKQINDKDVVLLIAGSGANAARLQRRIDREGLNDTVKLLGYRTDVKELLKTADCFIFPSLQEGLPGVSYFDEGRKISFEGEKFAVSKQLEKYLAHQYGDYMKLPAESSRVPKYYVLDIVRDV